MAPQDRQRRRNAPPIKPFQKTAKHAAGSAARNRLFLPWVITTFGGMGPASLWHYIDTIYSSSASLARLSATSPYVVARRKADFLACFQAILVRTCFAMLQRHTSQPDPADQPAAAAQPPPAAPNPPSPPASSRATTPDPDEAAHP